MIPFEEALEIVLNSPIQLKTEYILFTDSVHRILAEDVFSDMDMPPFDKSAMDGYACRKEDLTEVLKVIEVIPAGVNPQKEITKALCSKIMTGSVIPAGADCVIKVEETEVVDENHIRFIAKDTNSNICYKGEDIKTGAKVLEKGIRLQPQHIAVLASVGKVNILVYNRLKCGILSTGDELVEPEVVPGTSSIRNSNAWQLKAQSESLGISTTYYGIASDEKSDLLRLISKAEQENDVIMLTGGVSMGDFDLVPDALTDLGYTILFQKISVQPGSPTLYASKENKRVFGLPGNPVSSFVQFMMLVTPFAWNSMGYKYNPLVVKLPMASKYSRRKADRMSLIPVILKDNQIHILDYHGSAHIHAYTEAEGILHIDAGITTLEKGELGDVRLI